MRGEDLNNRYTLVAIFIVISIILTAIALPKDDPKTMCIEKIKQLPIQIQAEIDAVKARKLSLNN